MANFNLHKLINSGMKISKRKSFKYKREYRTKYWLIDPTTTIKVADLIKLGSKSEMAFDWSLTTSFEINGFRTSSFDAKEINQDEQLK